MIAVRPVAGMEELVDKTGTVIRKDSHQIGVEFDEPFERGHDCNGRGKYGHCRYGASYSFELFEEELTVCDEDKNRLDDFLLAYTLKNEKR